MWRVFWPIPKFAKIQYFLASEEIVNFTFSTASQCYFFRLRRYYPRQPYKSMFFCWFPPRIWFKMTHSLLPVPPQISAQKASPPVRYKIGTRGGGAFFSWKTPDPTDFCTFLLRPGDTCRNVVWAGNSVPVLWFVLILFKKNQQKILKNKKVMLKTFLKCLQKYV